MVTRRDGLVSHATWLMNTKDDPIRFALLLDHYPASAGRRELGLGIGAYLEGELAFYPSRNPLRAFLIEHKVLTTEPKKSRAVSSNDLWAGYQQQLSVLPWSEHYPHLLGAGRILRDSKGQHWWQDSFAEQSLPLSNTELPQLLSGCDLRSAFILWDGDRAELFSANTEQWGTITC